MTSSPEDRPDDEEEVPLANFIRFFHGIINGSRGAAFRLQGVTKDAGSLFFLNYSKHFFSVVIMRKR